jgi:succinyl-diaminopimelate desuccinylase
MKTALIKDIEKLISYKTLTSNTEAIDGCYSYIQERLKSYAFELETIVSQGKKSLLWKSKRAKTNVLLNAHIDVVPASEQMFTLKIENDNLLGRGVSDMKFAVACFIDVVETYYKKHHSVDGIHILLTSDEEIGGRDGVGYITKMAEQFYDVVIIPDGGDNFKLVEKAKGVLGVRITTKGVSAHASRIWDGTNAIDEMMHVLTRIRERFPQETEEVWKTTVNIGKVSGGEQVNQVPDQCIAFLDIRYIPEDGKEYIKKTLEELMQGSLIEYPIEAEAFYSNSKNKFTALWHDVLKKNNHRDCIIQEHGASDGRYFTALGIPVILSKPIGGAIHSEHEWLSISSLVEYNRLLNEYVEAVVLSK